MLNVNYPQRGGRGEGEIPPCAVSTESCAIEEEHLPAVFKGCWLHQPPWPRYSGDTAALNLTDLKPLTLLLGYTFVAGLSYDAITYLKSIRAAQTAGSHSRLCCLSPAGAGRWSWVWLKRSTDVMCYFSPPSGSEGKLTPPLCRSPLQGFSPIFAFFPKDKLPSGFRYKIQFWLLWLVARGSYNCGFLTSRVQKACWAVVFF